MRTSHGIRSRRTSGFATSRLFLAGGGAAIALAATLVGGFGDGALPSGSVAAADTHVPAVGAAAGTAAGSDARVELGRRLFLDPTVSRNARTSCSSCHEPEHGFSDPRRFSEDETGTSKRHSQPITDLGGRGFHWDGEFDSVRDLLVARLAPPLDAINASKTLVEKHFAEAKASGETPDEGEFNRRTQELNRRAADLVPPYYGDVTPGSVPEVIAIADRLNVDGRYASLVEAAYGDETVTTERLVDAMDAYIRTVQTATNDYDRHLAGHPDALGIEARRGLALFEGRGKCSSCHTLGSALEKALLTDRRTHNTGVAFRGITASFDGRVKMDFGAGGQTFVASSIGQFKTPSLRDVARHPPYMHDGSFKTLDEVVDYYDHGGTANAHLSPEIGNLDLTIEERKDLVAFLHSLTGDERAGLAVPPKNVGHRTELRMVDIQGRPLAGFAFQATPSGDRFRGIDRPAEPIALKTDARGFASFPFPATTHVTLSAARDEIGESEPLPDCVDRIELLVTPRTKVTLRVVLDGDAPETIVAMPEKATEPTQRALAYFRRVRTLAKGVTLYAAEAPADGGRVLARLQLGEDRAAPLAEIDLAGGASETLDLRPRNGRVVVPPLPRRVPDGGPPRPVGGGEPGNGARPPSVTPPAAGGGTGLGGSAPPKLPGGTTPGDALRKGPGGR